jgi:hypothetical protein
MNQRKLIEPDVIKYMIQQYQLTRINLTRPQAIYKTVAVNMEYLYESFKAQTIKSPETGTITIADEREKFCQEFINLANNLRLDNVIEFLNLLGEKADKIQWDQMARMKPEISKFTRFMHGIRDYQLIKILGPAIKPKLSDMKEPVKSTPIEPKQFPESISSIELKKPAESASSIEKEKYEFAKIILEHQKALNDDLISKIDEVKNKLMSGSKLDVVMPLKSELNKIRHDLIYAGVIAHLTDLDLIHTLYPPQFFTVNEEKDVLPSYPSVIQRNFCLTIIEFIYTKLGMTKELAGKSPEEIIEHFENHAIKQMKKNAAKAKRQQEALEKNKNHGTQNEYKAYTYLDDFLSIFLPYPSSSSANSREENDPSPTIDSPPYEDDEEEDAKSSPTQSSSSSSSSSTSSSPSTSSPLFFNSTFAMPQDPLTPKKDSNKESNLKGLRKGFSAPT